MTQFRFVLLFLIFNFSFLIFNSDVVKAIEPVFEPGGPGHFCSRESAYQDRSAPGCYVTLKDQGISTYNLYIPEQPRGQDENISETCFVVSRTQTLSLPNGPKPGYQIVTDADHPIFITTLNTEWPWDIPKQEDYDQLTLSGKLEQYIGDTFWKQGNSRTPTVNINKLIVDQHGALEKLQPLFFQVKDRVDYCDLLAHGDIFDEKITYVSPLTDQSQQTTLYQICHDLPTGIRPLDQDKWLDALIKLRQEKPDLAEAFQQITPYVQRDQVAWMVVYMYQYQYIPIDGPRTINPVPTARAIVKLNLGGFTRSTQIQQRRDDILVPEDLTEDTPTPWGFPVTGPKDLRQLEKKVVYGYVDDQGNSIESLMKQLGYETPIDCDLPSAPPDSEFEPGPPAGQNILFKIGQIIGRITGLNFGFDAELGTTFVGRCSPNDWQLVRDPADNTLNWECDANLKALANVHILNPQSLKSTCDEFYLEGGGSLRAHFPQDLMDQSADAPQPLPVPLLTNFEVFEAAGPAHVSSPGRLNDPDGKVDLPTVCQGETARALSLDFIGKALRPKEFINQPEKDINLIYQSKTGLKNALSKLFSLLSPSK